MRPAAAVGPRVRLVCRRNLPYMLRALFYAIPIVLAIFAIVDCVQTPDRRCAVCPASPGSC